MEPMLKGAAPQAAPADLIKDSDQTKFAKDVLEASRTVPVIVDFWAPWCGPCKQLQPAIEKVVKAANGAVKLVKINIDQNQMLAQQLRIQSIPAVYAFFGGRPVDGFMGAVPESQVKQFVDRLVQATGGAGGRRRRRARRAAGARQGRRGAERPGPRRAHLQRDPGRRAEERHRRWPASRATTCRPATSSRPRSCSPRSRPRTRPTPRSWPCRPRSISPRRPRRPGPVDDLKAKAAADPKDMQARLDLAMAYWAGNQRQEAIDELLAMIKADRKWNEEAARQQLLKFFEALGFTDPLAVDGRKRLSTILFS